MKPKKITWNELIDIISKIETGAVETKLVDTDTARQIAWTAINLLHRAEAIDIDYKH